MRILKGFKSCVLEVRILKELEVLFPEVRILKEIVASREKRVARMNDRKLVAPTRPGRALGTDLSEGGRTSEKWLERSGEGEGAVGERNIGYGSKLVTRCQYISLGHSNGGRQFTVQARNWMGWNGLEPGRPVEKLWRSAIRASRG